MPRALITDWSNGPMGPGWFIHHPATVAVWYDGGGFWELIDQDPATADQKKRLGEFVALILLMRQQ